jgi:hypothetical protein
VGLDAAQQARSRHAEGEEGEEVTRVAHFLENGTWKVTSTIERHVHAGTWQNPRLLSMGMSDESVARLMSDTDEGMLGDNVTKEIRAPLVVKQRPATLLDDDKNYNNRV